MNRARVGAVLALLGTLCVSNATLATPEQAAAEARLSVEQHKQKRVSSAYQHMARAAVLDPENEDYLVDAAVLSELAGNPPLLTIPFYHRATALASKRKDYEAVEIYNLKISRLASEIPVWVGEPSTENAVVAQMVDGDQKRFGQGVVEAGVLLEEAKMLLGARHPSTLERSKAYGAEQIAAALKVLQQAEEDAVTAFGEDHPEVQLVRGLIEQIRQQGDASQAAAAYRKTMAVYGYVLEDYLPSTLDQLMRLSGEEALRGEYGVAAQLLISGCGAASRILGELHQQTGACFQQLGLMQFRQGAYAEAEAAYGKASRILQGVVGKEAPQWVRTQIYRADLARANAAFGDAQRMLDQVTTAEKVPEPLKFEARGVVAQLLEDQGRYGEAERVSREILTHELETLGEQHPNAITTLNNLAGLQRKQSRFLEAEKGYQQALERSAQALGSEHPSTIAVMNNLALTLEGQGLYDRAEPLFRKALQRSTKVLGEAHPTTLANLNNLAMLHESQGLFEKAESLYRQAIEQLIASRGEKHPDTIAVLNNLGYLYLLQGRHGDAAAIFGEVLKVWRASLGERHQKTLKGMNNLGRVHHQLGELKRAEVLIATALKLRREAMGEHHIDTLRSQHDLGKLYMDMGRHEASLQLLQKTLRQAENHLGQQHPYTFETLNTLAMLRQRMGDGKGAFDVEKLLFERRNRFLDQMLWATSENAREGYLRLHRPELYRYMNRVSALEPKQAGRELARISLLRKGMLLQVASQIQQVEKMADDPALTVISDALLAARKELATRTLSGPVDESAASFLETIHQLEERISELEGELGRASIRFREATTELSLQQLEAHLPDASALVDYMIFEDEAGVSKLQAAILRREAGKVVYDHYLYEDLKGINSAIQEFREVIQDDTADEYEVLEFGMELYSRVWAPIAARIGEAEKV